jgi:hypothetical protein
MIKMEKNDIIRKAGVDRDFLDKKLEELTTLISLVENFYDVGEYVSVSDEAIESFFDSFPTRGGYNLYSDQESYLK